MLNRNKQELVIKTLYENNLSYREIADKINKDFNTTYWDNERVRSIIRKIRKNDNSCVSNIKVKQLPEQPKVGYNVHTELNQDGSMISDIFSFPMC